MVSFFEISLFFAEKITVIISVSLKWVGSSSAKCLPEDINCRLKEFEDLERREAEERERQRPYKVPGMVRRVALKDKFKGEMWKCVPGVFKMKWIEGLVVE